MKNKRVETSANPMIHIIRLLAASFVASIPIIYSHSRSVLPIIIIYLLLKKKKFYMHTRAYLDNNKQPKK